MRQRPYSESRVGDFSRISYLFSRRPGRESRPGNRKCRRFKRTRVTCFSRDQGLQGASSPVISSIVSTFLLSHFPYPRRLYPRSHTSLSLCRAISFARFAPTKSRKLWEGMREGEGKFFARNPRSDSPLPGPRDQPATLMMLSHRRDFWGGGKERERIYLAYYLGSR